MIEKKLLVTVRIEDTSNNDDVKNMLALVRSSISQIAHCSLKGTAKVIEVKEVWREKIIPMTKGFHEKAPSPEWQVG